MRTGPNGIQVPQDNDPGNVWADALENDLDRLDTLIGEVNNLDISQISRPKAIIDKANWDVDPDGRGYKQTVSLPSGLMLENTSLRFRITSGPRTNYTIYPTVKALSNTAYEVIVNDSTLDLEVLYA